MGGGVCDECDGRKLLGQIRCPHSMNTGTADKLFTVYREFKQYGVTPCSGGWYDQPALFLQVLRLCDLAIATLDEIADAKKQSLAKRAKEAKNGKVTRNRIHPSP